ncbi:CENP-B homolog protein 2-like protein [Tanacetum coccineum]
MTDDSEEHYASNKKDIQSHAKSNCKIGFVSNYGLQESSKRHIEYSEKFMKGYLSVATPALTFSIGWLGKFKARYGIKNFRRFGESGSVEMEGMEDKLKSIRDKVDHLKGKNKTRKGLTVCYFAVMRDGSEKLPLWIIGKYAKPRCFKNVNLNSLNCEYRANKRAWMTGVLFEEYVRLKLDKKKAWTMDVSANTIANCFRHCKLRSTDNMTFENSDEVVKALKNSRICQRSWVMQCIGWRRCQNHPEEKCSCTVVDDEEIIEALLELISDIDEEDDEKFTMEPPSAKGSY